jgi:transposase-like protein
MTIIAHEARKGLGWWRRRQTLDEVLPTTRHQRCWVHKTANILNQVALSVRANMNAGPLHISRQEWGSCEARLRFRKLVEGWVDACEGGL